MQLKSVRLAVKSRQVSVIVGVSEDLTVISIRFMLTGSRDGPGNVTVDLGAFFCLDRPAQAILGTLSPPKHLAAGGVAAHFLHCFLPYFIC
jgi:hypothetical protein